ncbi:septation protein SpoVG family protein [Endomicrobium proavitum]|uniref:septation protein SpoVG family protein n=1 Tax=Endomicrobium proavitum TaxID=1408281 RepID=UPI0006966855
MKVTEIKVFPKNEDKLKAYAAVTFDDCFVVHNLRIIKNSGGGVIICSVCPQGKETTALSKIYAIR